MDEKYLKGSPVAVREGVYYFTQPPSEFSPRGSTSDQSSWSAWRKANFAFYKESLEHYFPTPKGKVLVDIGAGPTQFDALFSMFTYIGVDFLPYKKVSVVTDLTKSLPITDGCADVIILSNVLEHIPYPLELLKECSRILKKGGVCIGTTPFLLQVHQSPYDFNRYTNYQLEHLLADCGFSTRDIQPLGKLIDVYDSMEIKFFVHVPRSPLRKIVRLFRRIDMLLVRALYGRLPASHKFTEGYGFVAVK